MGFDRLFISGVGRLPYMKRIPRGVEVERKFDEQDVYRAMNNSLSSLTRDVGYITILSHYLNDLPPDDNGMPRNYVLPLGASAV